MKAITFGLAFGVGWAVVSGAAAGSGMGAMVVLLFLAMLTAFFAGRRGGARANASAVAVASAEAEATSTAQAAAQGGSVVLNVYQPTRTDAALGWSENPGTVRRYAELTDEEILELAPDDDYADTLGTYYGEGPDALWERVEGERQGT